MTCSDTGRSCGSEYKNYGLCNSADVSRRFGGIHSNTGGCCHRVYCPSLNIKAAVISYFSSHHFL